MKKNLINCFKKFPNRNLIYNSNLTLTYKEFYQNSLQIIESLKNIGVKKGEIILLKRENSVEYLMFLLACCLGGITVCPIDPNTKNKRIQELKKIFRINHIFDDSFVINTKKKKISENNIVLEKTKFLLMCSADKKGDTVGIVLSSDAIIKCSSSFSKLAGYNKNSRILHCLPMFYMAGIVDTFFSPLFGGSSLILNQQFSIMKINNFWSLPIKFKSNILFLTPSIIYFLCSVFKNSSKKIQEHLKKYKLIISTGSKLNKELNKNFFSIFNKRLSNCYGATEFGGPISLAKNLNYVSDGGKHSKRVIIKTINKNSKNIIHIKSDFLMDGTLSKSGFKEIKLKKNDFYEIGDYGLYKDGLLEIRGTNRKIIKRGGELIHLKYIEKKCLKLKYIKKVLAFGTEDRIAGQELYLYVEIKSNYNKKFVQNELSKFFLENFRIIEMPKKIIISKKKLSFNNIKKLI